MLYFEFSSEKLAAAMVSRVGQCLMTCPTTAVFDGLPEAGKPDNSGASGGGKRLEVGGKLRFFGDGYQKSKVLRGRRYWRIPVMDGEFLVQEDIGCVKAIAGGNILLCGSEQQGTLAAARRAVEAMAPLPDVITPFPGGVVRSGSKVGSKYKGMFASSNDAFCPTLRSRVRTQLPEGAACVYEIVINGLSADSISLAMKAGITAACQQPNDLAVISAGNYGGKLGKHHFKLHEVLGLSREAASASLAQGGAS
jgi:formylmethanofuran--tetrahydromethanopterin N-formyltransferase